jgi:hypothetical protein
MLGQGGSRASHAGSEATQSPIEYMNCDPHWQAGRKREFEIDRPGAVLPYHVQRNPRCRYEL